MQTLPELQRRRAAPTSSPRPRRADPRGAGGCGLPPPFHCILHPLPSNSQPDQKSQALRVFWGVPPFPSLPSPPVQRCPPAGAAGSSGPRGQGAAGDAASSAASMLGERPPRGASAAPPFPRPRCQPAPGKPPREAGLRAAARGCLHRPGAEPPLGAHGLGMKSSSSKSSSSSHVRLNLAFCLRKIVAYF